jgi:hypothetical protein
MRLSLAISLITIAFALPSCASTSIGGTRVYGRVLHRVTAADIQAAIDADKRTSGEHKMFGEINEVDVVRTDEIHIYHGRRLEGLWPHCIVLRVNGKWRYAGEILMTS